MQCSQKDINLIHNQLHKQTNSNTATKIYIHVDIY